MPIVQNPLAQTSALALSVVSTPFISSPVKGRSVGSMQTSLQTSANKFAVRFLTSLWRREMKPPFLHVNAWSIEKVTPQSHVDGSRDSCQP